MNTEIRKVADCITDNRHRKEYYRSCAFLIEIKLEEFEVKRFLFRYSDPMQKYFGSHFRGETKDVLVMQRVKAAYKAEMEKDSSIFHEIENLGEGAEPIFSVKYYHQAHRDNEDGHVTMEVGWREYADKPSKIISEPEALEKFPNVKLFEDWLCAAVLNAVEWLNTTHYQLEILMQAEELSGWIAAEGLEKAKKELSYDEQLEALQSEFEGRLQTLKASVKAENVKQARRIVAEWDAETVPKLPGRFSAKAIEVAPQFWTRFISEPEGGCQPVIPGRVFGSTSEEDKAKIKPGDIFKG